MITILSAQILKATLNRPDWIDALANSWPSGHVAVVAGLVAGTVLAVPSTLRLAVVLTGGALVVAMSLATVALHWHRFSDVLASPLLAIAVASFFIRSSRNERSVGGIILVSASTHVPAISEGLDEDSAAKHKRHEGPSHDEIRAGKARTRVTPQQSLSVQPSMRSCASSTRCYSVLPLWFTGATTHSGCTYRCHAQGYRHELPRHRLHRP